MNLLLLKKACLLVALAFAGISSVLAQSYLSNVRAVTPQGEEYSTPKWSPDGMRLLFTNHNNDALYVVDVASEKLQEVKAAAGVGYGAKWSADGKSVVFKEKQPGGTFSQAVAKSIDLETKVEKKVAALKKSAEAELMVYINSKTLRLEAKYGETGTPWVITKEDGQFYHPILSPDKKWVVVHGGADMYLYAVDGKQERKLLGMGLASGWLPDGSGIVTFEDRSKDGHTVSASELFAIRTVNGRKTQLTDSQESIEMWPSVSPDGRRIAFSDERTGRIFVADFDLKK